jgi:hypothetical protein
MGTLRARFGRAREPDRRAKVLVFAATYGARFAHSMIAARSAE